MWLLVLFIIIGIIVLRATLGEKYDNMATPQDDSTKIEEDHEDDGSKKYEQFEHVDEVIPIRVPKRERDWAWNETKREVKRYYRGMKGIKYESHHTKGTTIADKRRGAERIVEVLDMEALERELSSPDSYWHDVYKQYGKEFVLEEAS